MLDWVKPEYTKRGQRAWTQAEDDWLRKYCKVKTPAEIADDLGRSEASITTHMTYLGIRRQNRAIDHLCEMEEMFARGCSVAEVAAAIDMSTYTVNRHYKKWRIRHG